MVIGRKGNTHGIWLSHTPTRSHGNAREHCDPGTSSGQYYAAEESAGEYLEPLALLSFLAGITSSAKLLTAVMVLPNRPPILTAKMLATIDVLSKGRVIVGCGVGWMREEFEALGAPPFEERGAVSNEYIQAFRELWTHDTPTFEGKYCRFSNVTFAPKPVQKPRPSGLAGRARRPCAERGASPTAGIPSGPMSASL
jgi:alkanesulfonate monooxygenase SsuD/methylene tetrahydromethanopterin reductase-like flavin-dependent oxidoreductase (luciferase family)